jgi:hypothetical protein
MPERVEVNFFVRNWCEDHLRKNRKKTEIQDTSMAMALGVSIVTSLWPCFIAISASWRNWLINCIFFKRQELYHSLRGKQELQPRNYKKTNTGHA